MTREHTLPAGADLGGAPAPIGRAPSGHLLPGEPVTYRPFFPECWEGTPPLTPWVGSRVALLTLPGDLDPAVMARFVGRLDRGWGVYEDLVGCPPTPLFVHEGRPTIAAVPDPSHTRGYACGYLGQTGIEVSGFYASDYPMARDAPNAFPHYYFYEMGRNWFVFGDRHSAFTTGFAVFMRYVCMDALGCDDPDAATRAAIERAVHELEGRGLTFVDAFTDAGRLDEKSPRLPHVTPSDQPVMYASAMLALRRMGGGDDWLRRFFARLLAAPAYPGASPDAALRQSLSWLASASLAMRRDLTGLFADRWRLPLTERARSRLGALAWDDDRLTTAEAIHAACG